MNLIGITGKTGTGKSIISNCLAQKTNGMYVDIDKIGHLATSDSFIAEQLCKTFGNNILDKNNNIDRKKLGNIVFVDKNKMQILTDLTWKYMQEKLDNILLQKQQVFVFDWALLPQVKYWNMCNIKILITSDDLERKKRILERDHISKEYLEKRESATLDYSNFKFDYVFKNDYTKETMNFIVEKIFNNLQKNN